MMGRIEKTVFISYRRTNIAWALAIYQDLTMHGYDVFFDYQSIDSGNFEKVILENIKARAHFIVILTPSALERSNCITENVTEGSIVASGKMLLSGRHKSLSEERHDEPEKQARVTRSSATTVPQSQ